MANNTDRTTAIIILREAGLPWVDCLISQANELRSSVRALTIWSESERGFGLGLTEEARWVRLQRSTNGICRVSFDTVALLPCLEVDREVFIAALTQALSSFNVPLAILDLFPFEELIVDGLKSDSEHWTARALLWVPMQTQSAGLTRAIQYCAEYGPTQKIRHAAKRSLLRDRPA